MKRFRQDQLLLALAVGLLILMGIALRSCGARAVGPLPPYSTSDISSAILSAAAAGSEAIRMGRPITR